MYQCIINKLKRGDGIFRRIECRHVVVVHVALAWEGGFCFTPYSEKGRQMLITHWPVMNACPELKRSRSSIQYSSNRNAPFSNPHTFLIAGIQSITNHSINQSSNQCYSTLTSIIALSRLLDTLRDNFTSKIKEHNDHHHQKHPLAARLRDFPNLSRLSVNLGHAACPSNWLLIYYIDVQY